MARTSGGQGRSGVRAIAIVTARPTSAYAQPSRNTQASADSAMASAHARSRFHRKPAAAAMNAYANPWLGLYRTFATQNGGTGGRGFMASDDRPSTANAITTPPHSASGEP